MLNVKKVLNKSTRAEKVAGCFMFVFSGLSMMAVALTFYIITKDLLLILPMFAFVGYCFWQADRCLKAAQTKSIDASPEKEHEHEEMLTAAIKKAERESPAFRIITKLLS